MRSTSRLTVEADWPKRAAIARIESPDARPREISSRSAKLSIHFGLHRRGGAIPPVAIGAVTREPVVEDGYVAGNPALMMRPGGEGPWPAVFFINGTVEEGRELSEVRRMAEGFARAGYLVVVPDLPGLRSEEITPETLSQTVKVAQEVAGWTDARDGEVGLVGVSTDATLALLAAGDPEVREDVSVVSGVAPYSDIRTVLSVATTGRYREDGELVPCETDPFLSYVIVRSLVAALPEGEESGDARLRAGGGLSRTSWLASATAARTTWGRRRRAWSSCSSTRTPRASTSCTRRSRRGYAKT